LAVFYTFVVVAVVVVATVVVVVSINVNRHFSLPFSELNQLFIYILIGCLIALLLLGVITIGCMIR